MNTATELEQMLLICDMHYAKCQQSFAKLISKENRLRAELARLSEMGNSSQAPETGEANMRAIGADVIWQGWLGRTKAALNLELAQVLAVKERHIDEVRQAYGKVQVITRMQTDQKAGVKQKANQAMLGVAIEMSLMKRP